MVLALICSWNDKNHMFCIRAWKQCFFFIIKFLPIYIFYEIKYSLISFLIRTKKEMGIWGINPILCPQIGTLNINPIESKKITKEIQISNNEYYALYSRYLTFKCFNVAWNLKIKVNYWTEFEYLPIPTI